MRTFRVPRFVCLLAFALSACSSDDAGPDGTTEPDATGDAGPDAIDGGGDDVQPDGAELDGSTDGGTNGEPVESDWITGDEALDQVSVFLGTGGIGFGYAALTPAAQIPNGLVKVGPDTTFDGSHDDVSHFSGYNAEDPQIRGFSHLRLVGTGAADLALLRFMPLAERPANPRRVWSEKGEEQGSPGYYAVTLPEEQVEVELTATGFAAIHRYSFGADGGVIVLDPTANVDDRPVQAADVTLTPDGFTGSLSYQGGFSGRTRGLTLWFDAEVVGGQPGAVWNGESWDDAATSIEGTTISALWQGEANGTVEIRIGVSLISAEQAAANRETELGDQSFEAVHEAARALWRDKLSRIEVVRGADAEWLTRFHSALYNLWRMPSRLDEPSGEYRGLDGEIHPSEGIPYYSDLSLWDSFRTLHPLYEWIDPELEVHVLHSLLRMGEQYGRVPRWPSLLSETGSMVGTPADQLFGGAAMKGLTGIDYAVALQALLDSLEEGDGVNGGRNGFADYVSFGFMPFDLHDESVSLTLEYAWSDDALANLAGVVGDAELEASLRARSLSFEQQFDPSRSLFWPRAANGEFRPDGNELGVTQRTGAFTEGSAWHWRFYALHAPEALVTLMGGPEALGETLEAAFAQSPYGRPDPVSHVLPDSYYWHGNQPAIGNVFLFAASDRPERMGYWIRQIQARAYGPGVDGLPGNDDGGTMSAWFVWSALGLYPVAGSDRHVVGAPLFAHARVRPPGGAETRISGGDPALTVVTGLEVNGVAWTESEIRFADLVGSVLRFTMQ